MRHADFFAALLVVACANELRRLPAGRGTEPRHGGGSGSPGRRCGDGVARRQGNRRGLISNAALCQPGRRPSVPRRCDISRVEYDNMVRDLLGDTTQPATTSSRRVPRQRVNFERTRTPSSRARSSRSSTCRAAKRYAATGVTRASAPSSLQHRDRRVRDGPSSATSRTRLDPQQLDAAESATSFSCTRT